MPNAPESNLTEADLERLYRSLLRIRRAEERLADIYPTDVVKSPVHLSIGQEAVAVGVCDVLEPSDKAIGTYRGHALYFAKGGEMKPFMAEMFGKAEGCARGKGGSMHLVSAPHNMLGSSAVVATHIPIAVGHAMAAKMRGEKTLVVCFVGDGSTEEGVFWESVNFAVLKKLPILFVCENNDLAIHARVKDRQSTTDFPARIKGFGLDCVTIRDMDVFAIRNATAAAVKNIRAGEGPQALECFTSRWRQHVGPGEDFDKGYRDRSEIDFWIETDQVARLAALLPAKASSIQAEVEAEIAAAIRFAEQAPFPDVAELYDHVYAD